MAFASSQERVDLIRNEGRKELITVQIITDKGAEVELAADSVGHALSIQNGWLHTFKARRTEIFRVNKETGELKPTIGPFGPDVEIE